MAFLVGGLSTNDWVWSRLQSYFMERKIRIQRADNHTFVFVRHTHRFSNTFLATRWSLMGQCYLTSIMGPRAIQQLHLPHVVQAAHHPSNHLIRNPLVPRASSSVRTIKCKYMSGRLQIYPDTSLATRFLIQGTRCVPYINIFFRERCNLRIINMIWCVRFPSRKTSSPINNLCLVVIQMERDLWHTKAEKADLEMTVKTLSPFTSTVTRNSSILTPILGDKTTGFEKTVKASTVTSM